MNILEKESNTEKVLMWVTIASSVLLFVVLTQPAWNSKKLIEQQTNDCKKVGGVQIIDHGMFGDTYSCEPHLDKGVAR
jgi:hypothetical protein